MAWALGIGCLVLGYVLGAWAKATKLADAQWAIDTAEARLAEIERLKAALRECRGGS